MSEHTKKVDRAFVIVLSIIFSGSATVLSSHYNGQWTISGALINLFSIVISVYVVLKFHDYMTNYIERMEHKPTT